MRRIDASRFPARDGRSLNEGIHTTGTLCRRQRDCREVEADQLAGDGSFPLTVDRCLLTGVSQGAKGRWRDTLVLAGGANFTFLPEEISRLHSKRPAQLLVESEGFQVDAIDFTRRTEFITW